MLKFIYSIALVVACAGLMAQGGLERKEHNSPPQSPPSTKSQQQNNKSSQDKPKQDSRVNQGDKSRQNDNKENQSRSNPFDNYSKNRNNPFDNYNQNRSNPFDHYTQINNLNNSRNQQNKFKIERPQGINLWDMVYRESDSRRIKPNFRSGYYQYNSRWTDRDFCYRYYSFNYYSNCRVSPWYSYINLPGYVINSRTIIIITPSILFYSVGDNCYWNQSIIYNWQRESDFRSDAVNSLIKIFERKDRSLLNKFTSYRDNIGIFVDEHYSYSINSDDYFDLMWDNVKSTNTLNYSIISVQSWREKELRIIARHDFIDPWNDRQSVYHTYKMILFRGQWVITDFGTTDYRPKY